MLHVPKNSRGITKIIAQCGTCCNFQIKYSRCLFLLNHVVYVHCTRSNINNLILFDSVQISTRYFRFTFSRKKIKAQRHISWAPDNVFRPEYLINAESRRGPPDVFIVPTFPFYTLLDSRNILGNGFWSAKQIRLHGNGTVRESREQCCWKYVVQIQKVYSPDMTFE